MNKSVILLSFLATITFTAGTSSAQNDLYSVGTHKQLFIDDAFFDDAENVDIRLHPATKTGEKVLQREYPWESATLNWFNVIQDQGVVDTQAKYRMWYECYDIDGWPTGDDTSFCYAESRDGVNWTKPNLGLFEYQGSTDNNILFRQIGSGAGVSRVHGTGVFIDPTAPPAERYKAFSQGVWSDRSPPHRIAGMYSADGISWTRYSQPVCEVFADSQYSGFWDADLRQYVLYGRTSYNGRAVGRSASSSATNFSPLQTVLYADANDPYDSDIYNPAALKYPGAANAYFMLPSLYQHIPDTLDIRLAVSRDGVNWTYPQQDTAFIPLGAEGDFDSKTLYMGQGILQSGDEMWLYYSGSPLTHNGHDLDDLVNAEQPRAYSRVVVKKDRFVSAEAGPEGGWFVTPPLTFYGKNLQLNADVRSGGSVRVELLDANGETIPGFEMENCRPITGDNLAVPVVWNGGGNVAARAGQATRMKVEITDASLFSYQFTTDEKWDILDETYGNGEGQISFLNAYEWPWGTTQPTEALNDGYAALTHDSTGIDYAARENGTINLPADEWRMDMKLKLNDALGFTFYLGDTDDMAHRALVQVNALFQETIAHPDTISDYNLRVADGGEIQLPGFDGSEPHIYSFRSLDGVIDMYVDDVFVATLTNGTGVDVGYEACQFGFGAAMSTGPGTSEIYYVKISSSVDVSGEEDHPGDANRDGRVDDIDATIMATNWHRTGGATWSQGDFNADGNVDASDAAILAGNWQWTWTTSSVATMSLSVPEPSATFLLFIGGLGLLAMLCRPRLLRR